MYTREAYNLLKGQVGNAVVTQHVLQLEATLTTTDSVFIFPLADEQGPAKNKTERRLNQNDIFLTTAIQISLAATAGPEDVTYNPTTYPNPSIFTTTGAVRELFGFYKGVMKITVDNNVIFDKYDLTEHLFIPRTQLGYTGHYDGINWQRDGWVPILPNLIFQGNRTNAIQIGLLKAVAVLHPETRVIMRLKGYLAKNAAPYRG